MTHAAVPPVVDIAAAGNLDRSAIGGKAASLAQMRALGLPVPPAFVITTPVCLDFLESGRLATGIVTEIDGAVGRLENEVGRQFGDPDDPLLVSVRSGAAISMPGMMDTILDLGIALDGDEPLPAWRDRAFARSCRDRFVEGFTATTGRPPPAEPRQQLRAAIDAVFESWRNDRAVAYRDLHGIDHGLGTAVVVQAMVFGNRSTSSGTGVAFSRNPNTGEPGLFGDYLACAQGEDVVGGAHATVPIAALGAEHPELAAELEQAVHTLELAHLDLVDVEFTIEDSRLFLLQSRVGKRAAAAAVRIAVDLVDEGLIDRTEALARVSAEQREASAHPHLDTRDSIRVVTVGLGACPGVARGVACFSADRVLDLAAGGDDVILVRPETSPADLHGMAVAAGVLTNTGGLVSHAALVARELDLPTVVGAGELHVDPERRELRIGDVALVEGEILSIDGATGHVVLGEAPVIPGVASDALRTLESWVVGAV